MLVVVAFVGFLPCDFEANLVELVLAATASCPLAPPGIFEMLRITGAFFVVVVLLGMMDESRSFPGPLQNNRPFCRYCRLDAWRNYYSYNY